MNEHTEEPLDQQLEAAMDRMVKVAHEYSPRAATGAAVCTAVLVEASTGGTLEGLLEVVRQNWATCPLNRPPQDLQ